MDIKYIIGILSIIIVLIIVALIIVARKKKENFTKAGGHNLYAPIDVTPVEQSPPGKLYGNYNNLLTDKLFKGGHVEYTHSIPEYCDKPNRNRNFLVNPIITQKSIFIKPNINAYKNHRTIRQLVHDQSTPYPPDWGNSAEDIRIGSDVEEDPIAEAIGQNIFYSNFSKVLNKYKHSALPPKAYMDNYDYSCGVDGGIPDDVYNNPY